MLLLSLSSSVVSYIAPTNLQRFDTCVIPMYGHAPFPVILGLISVASLLFILEILDQIMKVAELFPSLMEAVEESPMNT